MTPLQKALKDKAAMSPEQRAVVSEIMDRNLETVSTFALLGAEMESNGSDEGNHRD